MSSRLLQIKEIGGRSLVWTEDSDLRSQIPFNLQFQSGIWDLPFDKEYGIFYDAFASTLSRVT